MTEQEAKQWRPFHETIIDAIRNARDGIEMGLLMKLIKMTKIPKGHDEIIATLSQQLNELRYNESFGFEVTTDLLKQKREAEKKEEEKKAKEQTETATS